MGQKWLKMEMGGRCHLPQHKVDRWVGERNPQVRYVEMKVHCMEHLRDTLWRMGWERRGGLLEEVLFDYGL